MPARELPVELWQLVGRKLADDGAQSSVYSLARTCRLAWVACSAILGETVSLYDDRRVQSYITALKDRALTMPRRLYLYPDIEDDNDESLSSLRSELLSLVGYPESTSCPLEVLMLDGMPRSLDAVKVDDPQQSFSSTITSLLLTTERPVLAASLPSQLIGVVRRLCLRIKFDITLFELLSRAHALEHLVIIEPDVDPDTIVRHSHSATLLSSMRCTPRITVLNPMANTINHRRFKDITRCNAEVDRLARHPLLADVPIYRLSAEEPSSPERGAFHMSIEAMFRAETLWDWCIANGFRCGQPTGLGLVPY